MLSLETPLPVTVLVVAAVVLFSRWHPATRARIATAVLAAAGAASTAWAFLTVMAAAGDLPRFQAVSKGVPLVPTHRAGTALTLVAGLVLLSVAATAVRQGRDLRRVRSRSNEGVFLVADDTPDAYARGGEVVISEGLVRLLGRQELAVVLAHERSHVRHRHDRLLSIARLGTAAAPWLWPVMNSLCFDIERWADEDAAHATGDRELVARTIAKVALASHETEAQRPIDLAFGRRQVLRRVQAMLSGAPRAASPIDALATSTTTAVAVILVAATFHLHHALFA